MILSGHSASVTRTANPQGQSGNEPQDLAERHDRREGFAPELRRGTCSPVPCTNSSPASSILSMVFQL